MPVQIPSYIQGQDLNTYRVLLDMAQFCNSLEATVRDLNNHVAKNVPAKSTLALTPEVMASIEANLEAAGSNPLRVDSLPGVLLDPQGAGIPTASVLPNLATIGPGAAYFVGGILYIADKLTIPNAWVAITTSTAPQANHAALIGPVAGGPLTPTYRSLALSDLPALSGVTLTNPTIASGIAVDGSGCKHQSVTTGSIALSSTVDVDLTWATAFANTSYNPYVSLEDASNKLLLVGIKSFTAAKITVTITNTDAGGAHTGVLHGLGLHA